MSAKGLFIHGFCEAEVEAMLTSAKALLMEGKTVMSWNDGGTSVGKQFVMPVADIIEECQYALRYFKRQKETDAQAEDHPGSLSHVGWRLPH